MFQTASHGHNWFIIFIILSIEKSDEFLSAIDFPVDLDSHLLRPTARNFVDQYALAREATGQLLDAKISILFENTYSELVAALGDAKAREFCQWGNRFPLSTEFERSVTVIWLFILLPLTREVRTSPPLLPTSQVIVISTLSEYKEKTHKLLAAMDAAEAQPRDDWEEHAIEVYNGGEIYTPDKSEYTHPFDYIYAMNKLIEVPALLRKLQEQLGSSEFNALNRWVDSEVKKRNVKLLFTDLKAISKQA
jgi:hypothetical protein